MELNWVLSERNYLGYPLLERIRLTIGCFVLALAVIVGLLVGHHPSAIGFTISVLLLAAGACIVLTSLFQRVRDLPEGFDPFQPPDERTLRRRTYALRVTLPILIVLLFLALWKIRNDSARIYWHWAVIAYGVIGIAGLLKNMRRDQAKLKQFEDRRTI